MYCKYNANFQLIGDIIAWANSNQVEIGCQSPYSIYLLCELTNTLRNFLIIYRDALKRNYLLGRYYLEVEIEDLAGFDEMLSDKIHKQPTENLQIFEEAAREVADEITSPRPEGEEEVEDIQILLQSNANPTNIRDLKVAFFFQMTIYFKRYNV